jgi:hypothetical protein
MIPRVDNNASITRTNVTTPVEIASFLIPIGLENRLGSCVF